MAAEKEHTETTHRVSYGRCVMIWLGLIAFTGLTVALAGVDLGRWIIITTIGIAGVKSTLVLNVFMHLKSEDRIFRIFVLVALATFAIFITLTFFDYAFS